MILAIDTSTNNAGMALVSGETVIFEHNWKCGQNHTTEFLPRLEYLMTRHDIDTKEIEGLSVALGPGSFSGTRVGLSIAKGMAFSLGVPVAGISTLSVEAYPFATTGLPVCPVQNAGRGEIATALYQMLNGEWKQLIAERITTLDDLLKETTSRTVYCGELTDSFVEKIVNTLKENAVVPSFSMRLRRAACLAELGQKRLTGGEADDLATLQPIYLRRPVITQPKKAYGSLHDA